MAVVVAFVVAACSDESGTSGPLNDPAAAASAALDERDRQPQRPPTETVPATTIAVPIPSVSHRTSMGGSPNQLLTPEPVGETISDYNLAIDDCFNRVQELVSGRPTVITTRLPCDQPHTFQVFGRVEYPAEPSARYPSDDVMENFALQSCYRLFEDWTDTIYETSVLEIEVLTPDRDNFEDELYNYRWIHCLVRRVDFEPLLHTARSSRL